MQMKTMVLPFQKIITQLKLRNWIKQQKVYCSMPFFFLIYSFSLFLFKFAYLWVACTPAYRVTVASTVEIDTQIQMIGVCIIL